jgi:ribonuclease R
MTETTPRPRRRSPARRPASDASTPAATVAPTGVFRPHVRGFGFVDLDVPVTTPGGTTVTSCFVPPPMTKGLLADDRLEVGYQVEEDGRATATSATLRERVRTEVYGVVEEGLRLRLDPHLGSGAWTLEGRVEDLPVGVAVLADITGPTTADPSDEWEDPTSADALLERVRIRHRLPLEHPAEAVAEVAAVAGAGAGSKPRRGGLVRRDLRELTTLTIDSPSSRDLDDALSVYPADAEGGIRVCVHISDVAAARPSRHRPGRRGAPGGHQRLPAGLDPADAAAAAVGGRAVAGARRGPRRADRRDADRPGRHRHGRRRLRHPDPVEHPPVVRDGAAVLAGQRPAEVADDVLDALRWLRTAAARLGVQRLRRGGVEARRVEPELTVEVVEGEAATVAASPSNPANLLIERLMVAANESVAGWLVDRGLPGIFRVHPSPGADAAPRWRPSARRPATTPASAAP